jgi:4'-phosphopantetheinyl transferase
MTLSAPPLSLRLDPAALISIRRPVPGYRLAFVSIPRLLETCLAISVGPSFRTAPPLAFDNDAFCESFLGPDEIGIVNGFKALKKQVEWIAGRYAAKQLARQFLTAQPPLDITRIAYRTKGAPYFTSDPSLPLSISHSWDYAVAGLGLAPARVLGLDLEKIRPDSRNTILQTAFTGREMDDLQNKDNRELFLRWTAKEAYLKYIGMGFHESLKRIEILQHTIFHDARPVPSLTLHSHLPFPAYAFSMVC